MSGLTVSLTEDQIFTVLRGFLLTLFDPTAVEVIRGQENRVPEPTSLDYVLMSPKGVKPISTNYSTWDYTNVNPGTLTVSRGSQVSIQLDIHGPNSGNNVELISVMLRDDYACSYFAGTGFDVQPLYSSDPFQVAFENGEMQYENRWTMDAVLQANLIVSTPQDFAATLAVELIEIDSAYPPGA